MFNSIQARANKIAKQIREGEYDKAIDALTRTTDPLGNGVYNGEPALLRAVNLDYIELVELLLKRGADIKAQDIHDQTIADHLRFHDKSLPVLDLLIDAGFNIHGGAGMGKGVLKRALESYASVDYIAALLDRGAVVDGNILQMIVYRDNIAALSFLLEKGFSPDLQSYSGYTALHLSIVRNKAEFIDLLLSHGADATIKTSEGKLPCELVTDQYSELAMRLREAAGLPRLLSKPVNWKLTEEFEIAQTIDKKFPGQETYKLTEIFNFHRQTYTMLMGLGSSAHTSVKTFHEMNNPGLIQEMTEVFLSLGGQLPQGQDIKPGTTIAKSKAIPDV